MEQADPFDYVRHWRTLLLDRSGWWHSFELPDGTVIEGMNDLVGLRNRLSNFPIPQDLRGKRVLDIGAWDGWFSFEMERRGAEVVAIDNWDNPRFREIHSVLDSRVDYRTMDVYDLTPERVGRFDIVLFLGVLYHLKHPLLALERVCALTTDLAVVESFVLKEEHRPEADVASRPIMEFYETDQFGGQTDNWVGPSLPCLLAFCRTAGFARVELQTELEWSAIVACYRRWDERVDAGEAAPRLTSVFHNTSLGINLSSHRDDYVACWFDGVDGDLALSDVQPEVGGFGTRLLHVRPRSDRVSAWGASFKLPPGLVAGWHPVDLRIRNGPPSNSISVAIDQPVADHPIVITAIRDGTTGAPNQLRLGPHSTLYLSVEGLPEYADRDNVWVVLGSHHVTVTHVEAGGPDNKTPQVTVEVPEGMPTGRIGIFIMLGSRKSNQVQVDILR